MELPSHMALLPKMEILSHNYGVTATHGITSLPSMKHPSVSPMLSPYRYTGGGTLTGPAITKMTTQSFTTAAGHRAGIPKIAVVVTDGRSNNPSDTAAAAQKARAAGEGGRRLYGLCVQHNL